MLAARIETKKNFTIKVTRYCGRCSSSCVLELQNLATRVFVRRVIETCHEHAIYGQFEMQKFHARRANALYLKRRRRKTNVYASTCK